MLKVYFMTLCSVLSVYCSSVLPTDLYRQLVSCKLSKKAFRRYSCLLLEVDVNDAAVALASNV